MSFLDVVAKLAPGFAARYARNAREYDITRNAKEAQRLYQAATSTQYRKPLTGSGSSPDAINAAAGTRLRAMARHLEENHDLTNSVFDDLLNNTIGAGASKAPMVRLTNGDLAKDLNKRILELFDEYAQKPETTGEFGFEQMERLVARHFFRDGEIFIRPIIGGSRFNYQTPVPMVLDLLDADYCPFEQYATNGNVIQGIECNQWGAPSYYYFHKKHPGEILQTANFVSGDLKRVAARNVWHLKLTKRLRQRRGVPLIHSVLTRLDDINEYENSERIAARVAADFTFAITKASEASSPVAVNSAGNREFGMNAGMGFELMPGEDVKTIASDRPNTGLNDFRNAMLRAVAGGTGTRYSSISKDYNGTYSAQRQELVEGAISYRVNFNYFVRRFYRPVWQQFIEAARLSGAIPAREFVGVDMATLTRCEFRPPSLPWIDVKKEADAYKILIESKLESRGEIMRQRGRDPQKVIEELQEEADNELFGSMVDETAQAAAQALQQGDDDNDDENETEDEAA